MKTLLYFAVFATCLWSCSQKKKQDVDPEKLLNELMEKTDLVSEETAKGMISSVSFGSKKQPIRFYLTKQTSEDEMREKLAPLFEFLTTETGLFFEMHIPSTYQDMIMAFARDEAHVALMNSLSYIKAKDAYGVKAQLKIIRFRSASYYGQIIASAELGIEDIEGLQGKSMAYTDPASASGYLYPHHILFENNIVPSKVIFGGSHSAVVRMIYNGEVDAGATYYSAPDSEGKIRDARARLLDEYPDLAQKVKVVTITRPIPNDPIAIGRQIDKKLAYEIGNALIKFMSTPEAKTSLGSLYGIDGFVRANDMEYNTLREAMFIEDSLANLPVPTF
ncbi:phosphate/phosphite/phosphonate ABC transporter substrate-binding protein [Reichenbachiella carrageenanivorans]|uniref:Phosphate/phosphite/phosphonate ABC transporter substrate-binding protein n=1 Tax=Reichenbachiella carrageenanivorans TaxID=2979869 RepID=A0ABY6D440_9BACT|nr:phosphate/phosphite/phosphonate ABC transporter substrate-binding protein [Reichenbachiella carrageenanivorans]UXX80569.1 phosphate/phosphite/phosphonate ABC transporter substrate-binding protein [Reichenbachiella carrageenanivorans]